MDASDFQGISAEEIQLMEMNMERNEAYDCRIFALKFIHKCNIMKEK